MRFEKRLLQEQVPEWKEVYLPYHKLKKRIYETKEAIIEVVREQQEVERRRRRGRRAALGSHQSDSSDLEGTEVTGLAAALGTVGHSLGLGQIRAEADDEASHARRGGGDIRTEVEAAGLASAFGEIVRGLGATAVATDHVVPSDDELGRQGSPPISWSLHSRNGAERDLAQTQSLTVIEPLSMPSLPPRSQDVLSLPRGKHARWGSAGFANQLGEGVGQDLSTVARSTTSVVDLLSPDRMLQFFTEKPYEKEGSETDTSVDMDSMAESTPICIAIDRMKPERAFWEEFEAALLVMDHFYDDQCRSYVEVFHALAMEAVSLGLIDKYVPMQKQRISRVARELARAGEPHQHSVTDVSFAGIGLKDDASLGALFAADAEDDDAFTEALEHHLYPIRIVAHEDELRTFVGARRKTGESTSDRARRQHRNMLKNQDRLKRHFQCSVRQPVAALSVSKEFAAEVKGRHLKSRSCFERARGRLGDRESIARISSVREGMKEYYRGLILLRDFCNLNTEGVRKIAKKHDKELGTVTQAVVTEYVKRERSFGRQHRLTLLIAETEQLYSLALCAGHRTQAMDQLRILGPRGVENTVFSLGLVVGITVTVMLLMAYVLAIQTPEARDYIGSQAHKGDVRGYLVVYRTMIMSVVLAVLWGFDLMVWEKFRVNYVFIFEFNPREHVRWQHVFQGGALLFFLWTVSLAIFVLSSLPVAPPGLSWLTAGASGSSEAVTPAVWPLSLAAVYLVVLASQQYRADWWLVRTLGRIASAPLRGVAFRDFFLADQLLSVTITLYDFFFSVCFFLVDYWQTYSPDEDGLYSADEIRSRTCFSVNTIARPIIACIPVTWRALQCLRRYRDSRDVVQLWNFGKYCTAYTVILSSSLVSVNSDFLAIWLLCILGSTVYTYYWDSVRDWSFVSFTSNDGSFLKHARTRKDRLYAGYSYYFSMASNLILRLLWTLTISPDLIPLDPLITETGLSLFELLRRAQWNIYRLENEQLNNIGKFRAVKHVPVVLPGDQREYLERYAYVPTYKSMASLEDMELKSDSTLEEPASSISISCSESGGEDSTSLESFTRSASELTFRSSRNASVNDSSSLET